MPRRFRYITETIRAKQGDIINYLDVVSHKHGDSSWLMKHPNSKNRVCLVAHIDTVFAPPKNLEIKGNILVSGEGEGLGADDRAGVWACLKIWSIMPDVDKPMMLFTDGEERGGIGAREACGIFADELADVIFFVELDRQGHNDCVFYNNEPNHFVTYIESFGFKKSWGSFSDITILGKHFKKCAVNLSVGYNGQHSTHEELNIKWLKETVLKTAILLEANSKCRTVWMNGNTNSFSQRTSSFSHRNQKALSSGFRKNQKVVLSGNGKSALDDAEWKEWAVKNPDKNYGDWIHEKNKAKPLLLESPSPVIEEEEEEELVDTPLSEEESKPPIGVDLGTIPISVGKCQSCGKDDELIFNTCKECAGY